MMGDVLPPFPECPRPDVEGPVKGLVFVFWVLLFEAFPPDLPYGKVQCASGFFGVGEGAVGVFVAVPRQQEILCGRSIR